MNVHIIHKCKLEQQFNELKPQHSISSEPSDFITCIHVARSAEKQIPLCGGT